MVNVIEIPPPMYEIATSCSIPQSKKVKINDNQEGIISFNGLNE